MTRADLRPSFDPQAPVVFDPFSTCRLSMPEPAPPPPATGAPDILLSLAIGAIAGAACVRVAWILDRWRNRPILLED